MICVLHRSRKVIHRIGLVKIAKWSSERCWVADADQARSTHTHTHTVLKSKFLASETLTVWPQHTKHQENICLQVCPEKGENISAFWRDRERGACSAWETSHPKSSAPHILFNKRKQCLRYPFCTKTNKNELGVEGVRRNRQPHFGAGQPVEVPGWQIRKCGMQFFSLWNEKLINIIFSPLQLITERV